MNFPGKKTTSNEFHHAKKPPAEKFTTEKNAITAPTPNPSPYHI